jgi:hypothetical protein
MFAVKRVLNHCSQMDNDAVLDVRMSREMLVTYFFVYDRVAQTYIGIKAVKWFNGSSLFTKRNNNTIDHSIELISKTQTYIANVLRYLVACQGQTT